MSGFYPGRADYNNGVISVDEALNNPTVIEQRIGELATPNLLIENIFSSDSSPVEGGAVIYSKTTEKNFYTDNDVTQRQPGDEYSVVYRERPEAQLARVEDYGGKFATSDEARKRNSNVDFDNNVTALTNTITRKLNAVALDTVKEAVTANETVRIAATDIDLATLAVDGDPANITAPQKRPTALWADAFAVAEEKDLGITYSKLIVSPQVKAQLLTAYGSSLKDVLDTFGLEMIASNHLKAANIAGGNTDTMLLVDPGKAGFVKYEEALTVTTWRDEAHRQTWTQAYAMPVMGITLPSAIASIELANL